MIAFLSVLLTLSATSQTPSKGAEFLVRTRPGVPVERLASAVGAMGKIESRKRGTSIYLVQLKPGITDFAAKSCLAKLSGIHLLTAREEQLVVRSVRTLGESITGLDEDRDDGTPTGGVVAVQNGEKMELRNLTASGKGQPLGTDSPDRAVQWRRLALVDEHGRIPPNALQVALNQKAAITAAFRGMSSGQGWIEQGPSNFSGRSLAVVIDPTNPQRLWTTGVGGGIWRSIDGGQTWTAVGDGLPSLAVSTLVLDPNDNKTLYAGTGEGYFNGDAIAGQGIFKSSDGGTTWSQLPGASGANWTHINRIAICPGNSNIILVTKQYGGIFRSTDGGKTFSNPLYAQSGHSIAYCQTNPQRVIGTIQDYSFSASSWYNAAVYSTDGGITWAKSTGPLNNLTGFGRVETYPVVTDQTQVYASASDGNVYKSSDGGQSYTKVNTSGTTTANWYANGIWVDPTNSNRLVLTGTYVYGSTDGGATITEIGQGYIQTQQPHPDVHTVVAAPGYDGVNNKMVYVCTDGGLYATLDITTASMSSGWFRLDQGVRTTQYYSVAGDGPTNLFVGGLQDNGSEANTIGNGNAFCFFGGDGGYVAIDPINPLFVYGEYIDLKLFRNNDGATGNDSGWIYNGITDAGGNANFIAPFILDPNQPLTLLAGGSSLWRTTNAQDTSPSWSAIRAPGSSLISAIAVANGNSDVIWVGQNDGGIAMTTNGTSVSPTWKTISTPSGGPIPGRYVTRILIDPDQSNVVYVTLGGFSASNVWKSTNSGATWVSITGSGAGVLPQVPVRAIARRPDAPQTLYIGTEIGLFSTTDGGKTWTTSSDMGLNVSVDDLQYMNNSGTLLAATHGRGIWSLPFGPGILMSLGVSPASVQSGGSATGTVKLNSPAGSGGASISLSSNNSVVSVPATITVPAGATSATFQIIISGVSTSTVVNITASLGDITKTATLTVGPPTLTAITLAPAKVIGGTSSTGTATLQGIAPTGGTTVSLTSGNAIATVPGSVTVSAGSSSATFSVTTTPVASSTSAVITATLGNGTSTASLTISAPSPSTLTLNPTTVEGGFPSVGMVTLNGPAPTGGIVLSVSSNSLSATVPSSVTVAAGATTATFSIPTSVVTQTVASIISVSLGTTTLTASLSITPEAISTVSVSPASVIAGGTSTGTVTLVGPSPTGGTTVALSSTSGSATVPTSVQIPAGSTSGTFNITTGNVSQTTQASINATFNQVLKSTTLTINPVTVTGLSLSPTTVTGGSSSIGTFTLSNPAPTGGLSVSLKSGSSSATVPATVTILAGATTGTFTVGTTAVTSTLPVTITATLNGTSSNATLTILTPLLAGLTVSPTTVLGGNSSTGTVTLARPAPDGGVSVNLTATVGATTPTSVTIAAGATSATFNIATAAQLTTTTSTISASLSGTTQSAVLTISAPSLIGFTVSPSTTAGGSSVVGTVTLNGIAPPSGTTVKLSSNNTAVSIPTSVVVSGGQSSATVQISTGATATTISAILSASLGTTTLKANLTIQAASLSSVTITPGTVVGGSNTSVLGMVTLDGRAITSGATVTLSSSSTTLATVPATVKVPGGMATATFPISHKLVTAAKSVTITATYGGVKQSATLSLAPFQVVSLAINPSSVIGGSKTTGNVQLNAQPGASGAIAVKLLSNSKSLGVSPSVSIPVGQSGATFSATSAAVATTATATVTASYGSSSAQSTVTIQPATLVSLTVAPTSVKGGSTTAVIGTVLLTGPAPTGGFVVTLFSSNTAVAKVPASVTVAAGKTTATFKVTDSKVTGQTSVTLSASLAGITKTVSLSVTP